KTWGETIPTPDAPLCTHPSRTGLICVSIASNRHAPVSFRCEGGFSHPIHMGEILSARKLRFDNFKRPVRIACPHEPAEPSFHRAWQCRTLAPSWRAPVCPAPIGWD